MAVNDSDSTLDAVTVDPSNARRHDARTLELIADALRDVVIRRWEDPTDRPTERITGTEIVE